MGQISKRISPLVLAITMAIVWAALAASSLRAQCPLNDPNADFFVRQQYRDFLGREPTPTELSSGVAPINSCYHLGDLACANTEKVKMSRNMFDHPNFRQQSRTFGLANSNPPPQYNSWDFIFLCYQVYLRRNPNDPPDNNWDGFNFWKSVLDNCTANSIANGGNGEQCYRDIVNAFLQSSEYRARFGC
jgi:hypothetical protein